jgi:CPA1 family monovalent cation:H+ antiporter
LSLLNPGDADKLVPETFLVIVVTVAVYGLTAGPLAQRLKLALPNPQGLLIASAHAGARALATAVQKAGFPVLLVDTNRDNVRIARMEGLSASYASILSEHALEELDLGGLGRMLTMTRNDEVNALACLHFSEVFGSAEIYQLVQSSDGTSRTETSGTVIRGRRLFGPSATYGHLDERFASGGVVKTTKLTSEFDLEAFQELYGETALVLFVVTESGSLSVNTLDKPLAPKPGETLIALVEPREEEGAGDVTATPA